MSTPAQEYWTKAVDSITDAWNYFRDRSRILKTSGAAATVQGALKNSPFKFAILSIVVPALFIDGGLAIYKTFRDLPPTQIERRIASDKEIEEISHQAASFPDIPPSNAQNDSRSTAELQREFDALHKERDASKPRPQMTPDEVAHYNDLQARMQVLAFEIYERASQEGKEVGREGEKMFHGDRMLLQALLKSSNLEQSYWLLVLGGSLVLNAALFRFLLRRKRDFFPFADQTDVIYLYVIGALFLMPQTAAAILNAVADLAVRFDWDSYLEYHNLLLALIGVWCILLFRRAAKMIAGVVVGSTPTARQQSTVTRRLIISQLCSFVAIQLVLALFSIPTFLLILKLQK
jgi:hypothetical protein